MWGAPHWEDAEELPPTVGRGRAAAVMTVLVLALGAFVYRIVEVQAMPDERILNEVSIPLKEVTVPATRGMVLGRTGRTIALSLPAATVISNPRQIGDAPAAAEALSEVLGIPAEELLADLQGDAAFRYVVRQVDPEVGDLVRDLEIDGIRVLAEPRREHPNGACSALAVVGRVNIDHQGMSGIEETHNEYLGGTPGRVLKERSARGATIPGGLQEVTEAVPGRDLTVTLDRNVQFQTERIMIEAVANAGASSGVAVVTVPSTGEIIAMANVSRGSDGMVDCTRHNLAATWSYEPGSVFKPVTVAAALASGTVAENHEVSVPSQYDIYVGGELEHRFEDDPAHGAAMWTPSEIISRSSNLGTITMARRAGKSQFYSTMRSFGFGERTALGLKGETRGILPEAAEWNILSLPNMAIGQGLAVTPLQLAQAYNAIANGGVREPLELIAAGGPAAPDGEGRLPERIMESEQAAALLRMLSTAVEEGTGRRAAVEGFSMAGKTGTAWQPCDVGYDCVNDEGEPVGRHYTATFAGIVSNDDGPVLVVLVAIDDPRGERFYGGQLAAPAVSEIATYALRQMRIPARADHLPGERRRAEPATEPPQPAADPAAASTLEDGAEAAP